MVKLFIGGFPMNSSELEIVQLFGIYGDVSTIKIVRDKASGKPKGYAFVEMPNREEAENAILGIDGSMMSDRELRVHFAVEKPAAPVRKPSNYNSAPKTDFRPKRPRK